jgi:two-component sensor histidine kinase/CHASE3 domain sensor protein
MSISRRFVIGSAIALLAVGFATLLGIIAATMWLGDRVQDHFQDVIAARETRSAAVELRSALQTAESSQRGLLVSGNEIYLAPYDRAKTIALNQLETLGRLLKPFPETQPLYQRLSQVVADKISDMDRSIALKNQRNDEEALRLFRTNRGKALMDEANVFLSGIIRSSDARLTASVSQLNTNATGLRWASGLGAIVIVIVVAGVVVTLSRYTREVAEARDEVRQLNTSLEARVAQRTTELARARDRAETLLDEVNHRVANSLAMVASLVKLQSRAVTDGSAKNALAETEARINAIASVHKKLYTSGNVQTVDLRDYMSSILDNLAGAMQEEGLHAKLLYEIEPLTLRTDASINLGVIATEWVTNAYKYAYPEKSGEIRVQLRRLSDDRGELLVEDSGVGRPEQSVPKGTGLGTRLVRAMAESIDGDVRYVNRAPGLAAQLTFPLQV